MKYLLTTILFSLLSICSTAQGYYWVGGTGNWSDLSHWATSSGGATQQTQLPSATDNVFFDANSFNATSQVVTLDIEANCNTMDWTGAANFPTITGNGNDINIYGSLVLSPDMAANFSDVEFEGTNAGNTITTNGTSLGPNSITRFNGVGGEWTLQDNFTTGDIFLSAGTFTTNNNNINSANSFQTTGSNAKVLNLGSSEITSERWWILGTNQTIIAGTSKIIVSSFYGDTTGDGPFTYYDVEFYNYASLRNNATFNEITVPAGLELILQSGDVFTLNNLVANGTKHNVIQISSTTTGSQATFSKASGSITVSYVELADVFAAGGANFIANNSVGNGNTSGWTINPVVGQDYYWVGNSGNWSDFGSHWATTSGGAVMHTDYPGKADNVYFDENSFTSSGQIITLDLTTAVFDMDWTGVTNSPTFLGSFSYWLDVYGSVTFTAEVTKSVWNLNLKGSGTHTYTNSTNGSILNFSINGSGTYTLQDSLYAQSINFYEGTINTNNKPIRSIFDVSIFGSSSTTIINMGSSNIYARNFSISNYSYQPVINRGTSTLNLSGGVIIQSNTVSGFTFYNVILDGTGTLEGSNTYENLTIEPGASIVFEDNETTSINGSLNLIGTKASPITINTNLAGTQSSISMNSGTVNGTYLVLKDIAAIGGATFNATQTIDNGNNTGWNITGITGLEYYWVGNSGLWSDFGSHWATTSGGSTFHTEVPGILDNIIFDTNSFTVAGEVVTIDNTQVSLNDLDASATTNGFTLSGAGKEMNIYGSVDIPSTVTVSISTYNFLSVASETLNFNGGPGYNFDANFLSAGTWDLASDLTLDQLIMESGTINTNNFDVNVDFELRMNGSNAKTLNLGTSTLTLRGWMANSASNITVNGGSSDVFIQGNYTLQDVGSNSINLNNLTFTTNNANGSLIYQDINLSKLTVEAGKILKPVGNVTITATEFVLVGTENDPIIFTPQTAGATLTLSKATGTVDAYYLELQDAIASGGATFNAYSSIDNGGVIGWIFNRTSQTITFNSLSDKLIEDPDFDISASASSGLPVSFSIVSGPATISGSTITLTGLGTVEVKAEQAGNIDYDPAPSVTNSFEVVKADQSIIFEAISDIVLGEVSSIELVASATSGLAVEFSVVGPATITGTTLTPTSVGMVTVTAKQLGNTSYNAATEVDQAFEIIDNVLGLEDLKANNIKIYPQPAQNKFYIGQSNKEFSSIIIYDLNGIEVLQKGSTNDLIEVNTTVLPNGIYFLRLIGKTKTYTTRIVIGK